MLGTVKRFDSIVGYGFIRPDGGGIDVFVHLKAVQKAGLETLQAGDRVEFEAETNPRDARLRATSIALAPAMKG